MEVTLLFCFSHATETNLVSPNTFFSLVFYCCCELFFPFTNVWCQYIYVVQNIQNLHWLIFTCQVNFPHWFAHIFFFNSDCNFLFSLGGRRWSTGCSGYCRGVDAEGEWHLPRAVCSSWSHLQGSAVGVRCCRCHHSHGGTVTRGTSQSEQW